MIYLKNGKNGKNGDSMSISQFKYKRNLVRLYRLVFDSSAIISLVFGFMFGGFVVSMTVLEAFQDLDKSQLDVCVKSSLVSEELN